MRQLSLLIVVPILIGCAKPLVSPTAPTAASEPTTTAIPIAAPDTERESGQSVTESAETLEPPVVLFTPEVKALTEAGCCVNPFWSIDGQTVMYLDKPTPDGQLGIYGVPITGGEPQLATDRIGLPSPDQRYRAYLDEFGQTIVEPFNSEVQWVIPNGGLRVFFSPQSTRLAWSQTTRTTICEQRPTTISIADIDGSDPKEVITLYCGGFAGWLDEDHLLLTGRVEEGTQDVVLFSLNVLDGTRTDIVTNQRIRNVEVANGGEWIMYTIMLHPEDSSNDGIWVVKRDGTVRYKLAVVGSAHWRDATHLLIVPFEIDVESHKLWEFDVITGEAYAITDPTVTKFKIANGDWAISPTGNHIVMLGENEGLWLLTLPPLGYRLP